MAAANKRAASRVMAAQAAERRLTVQRLSGEALSLTGKPAVVAAALIAAGEDGLSRMDVQPWCWDLASAIRDLRAQLGRDAIQRISGDRRRGLPCRYRLIELLAVVTDTSKNGALS